MNAPERPLQPPHSQPASEPDEMRLAGERRDLNLFDAATLMEGAYAIEVASSPALRALLMVVNPEHAKMLWCLGFMTGTKQAYDRVLTMQRGLD